MKKSLNLLGLILGAAILVLAGLKASQARITGTSTTADSWCSGASGAEVCIDSTGNVVPTTTGVGSLGTSALKFKDIYASGTVTLTASAIDTAELAADAVTTAKILEGAVDTGKLGAASVTTVKIADGAVDTAKLAIASVTNAKILSGTIDTSKIKKASGGAGALCELNDGSGNFGHCTNSSAVTCTCQ
jgi:hypothetical protein